MGRFCIYNQLCPTLAEPHQTGQTVMLGEFGGHLILFGSFYNQVEKEHPRGGGSIVS